MKIKTQKSLLSGLIFSLYMFAFSTTLTLADTWSALKFDEAFSVTLHYVDYVFLLVGLLLSAAFGHKQSVAAKKLHLSAVALAFFIFAVFLRIADNHIAFGLASVLLSFLLGLAGSTVYYLMSVNLHGNRRMGLVMAVSSSASVLLKQVTMRLDATYVALLIIAALLAVRGWIVIIRPNRAVLDWTLLTDAQELPRPTRRQNFVLLSVVVIILCLEFISGFNDGFYVRVFSQGAIDLYGWPRLLMIPAFLLAGFFADLKKSRFFSVSVICMFMMSVFAPIFLMDKRFYLLNLCLFYPYLAFLISYFTISFWTLAPKSRNPELLAPAGRIMDCAAAVFLSFWRLSDNYYVCIAAELVLLIIALAMALWQNQLAILPHTQVISGIKTLDDFLDSFSFTDKEKELTRIILTQDISMKEVASLMYSSERGIYRYLNSIYEKIGTDSRTGLFIRYHEFIAGSPATKPDQNADTSCNTAQKNVQ